MTRPRFGWPIGGDPRWFEAASALCATGWGGVAMLVPDDLATHPGYAPLGLFIPGALLGLVLLVAGLAQGVAVMLDHQLARIPLAAALSSAWLLVAFAVAGAAGWSPSVPVMGVLGLFDAAAMLVLIRLHRQRRLQA